MRSQAASRQGYQERRVYLQFFTEGLRVGNILVVLVSLVKPGAATHFRYLLLPVHCDALPLLQMHVVPSPRGWDNHIFFVSPCRNQGLKLIAGGAERRATRKLYTTPDHRDETGASPVRSTHQRVRAMAVDTNVLRTQARGTASVRILGEIPQVKLPPKAEGKMKALNYNCLPL